MSGKHKICDENENEVRTMLMNSIKNDFFLNLSEFMDEDDDDDISKIKNKQRSPSLDELLEKIKEKGLNSLTEKELIYLNKYSN
jgi:hypothetical protein